MKRTRLPRRFQILVATMPYVTVATTCPDGKPWNTPLVGFFDDDLNLYWASDTMSQHSRNIAHDPRIFVVVYNTGVSLGQGTALYMEMTARRVSRSNEVIAAKQIYLDRYGETGHEPFVGSCPRRIYKATPMRIWSNVDGARGSHFIDIREEILTTAREGIS
jgi:hypothetical protein